MIKKGKLVKKVVNIRGRGAPLPLAIALPTVQTGAGVVSATGVFLQAGDPTGTSLANPRHPSEQLSVASTSGSDLEKTRSNDTETLELFKGFDNMVEERPLMRKKRKSARSEAATSSTRVGALGLSPEQVSKRQKGVETAETRCEDVGEKVVERDAQSKEGLVTDLTMDSEEELVWAPIFSVGKRPMTLGDNFFDDPYVAKGVMEGLLRESDVERLKGVSNINLKASALQDLLVVSSFCLCFLLT